MKDLIRILKALADETRLQMLALIIHRGELCVCDCMQVLEITQSKTSRHLRYLANAGLLEDRRDATWVYYSIAGDLDPQRLAVLDAVRTLVTEEMLAGLCARLDEWRVRKAGAGCSASGDSN